MGRLWGAGGIVLANLGLGAALASGCAIPDDDPIDGFEFRSDEGDGGIIIDPDGGEPLTGADDGGGGRSGGDWIINGLSEPTVSGVRVEYALDSPQGLGAEGWLAEGDPAGEKVIRYLVECALDQGDGITVIGPTSTYVFEGDVGLAPEWKTGPCNNTCQQWVSACLLARINESGADVMIFVQGGHPSLGWGTDPLYPNFEGTFFGNVFTDPAAMYACRGTAAGTTAAIAQGRNCTVNETHCGFTTLASCTADAGCIDGYTGLPTINCQPDPQGPVYQGIAVHVRNP
jgi:hypothetical protein